MRLVRGRGTAAVRATRLLLDRRGRYSKILHASKNNMKILLRRRYSSHLCDLLVARPNHSFPAARQYQLQDPRWRRGAVKHALPQIGRRLDVDRVVGWEGARRGEDVLRDRLQLSTTAPANGVGVVVMAMYGVVRSTPASSAAFDSSSSVSAGPPWSVGATAANEFPGGARVGSSGVVDGLRASPRLFFERALERVFFYLLRRRLMFC